MKNKLPQYLIIPLAVFLGIAFLSLFTYFFHFSDSRAAKADRFYRNGEIAENIAERKKAFNEALTIYMQLESDFNPDFGNGKLYYNLGNTYFQIEEYPWAVLYYLKSQALMPREKRVETNLALARSKLSLPQADTTLSVMSLPERLQIFSALAVVSLLLISAWIWTENRWFKNTGFIAIALAGLILLSLGYTHYLSPLQGVLVQASDLYRDAGIQYAKVGKEPLPAGSTVEILGSHPNGKWFKVLAANDAIGYVPQDAIRAVGE
jgi:tetratricopeptide (TPR) repeat protein